MKTRRPTSLISLLIALVILCAASVASGEPAPEPGNQNTGPIAAEDKEKPLYEVWDEEIAGRCSLGVAMDGSVLLFKDTQEPDFVWVKRSEDGGKTWGEMIKVGKRVEIKEDMTDDGRYKNNKDVQWSELGTHVVDENTGDILVFSAKLKGVEILYRSKDNGKTWTTEDIVIKPDVNGWVTTPNAACDPGTTLRFGPKKGRLLQPSRVFVEYLNKGKGGRAFDKHYANAIYSDDGGKTWIPSAPFPLGGTGESGLVELRDGTIYHNSRTHMRPGNRRIAYSKDAGETWVDEHEDDELFDGPPDVYGCKAALLKLRVDDRDVLLFSSPGNRETRTDITVWLSFDGGQSWPQKRLVRQGPGNYTWMAAGRKGTPSEGMIYLVAGKDWMARFNLAWLLEGAEETQTPAAPPAKPSKE